MKRLWHFFSRMDLGFWLMMCVSLNLFVGVLVTMTQSSVFKEKDVLLLPLWIQSVADRPSLYLWVFTLFVLLFLLAVNTIVCSVEYVRSSMRRGGLLRKLAIVLFHAAFICALCGHCMSEFTGMIEQVILDAGKMTQVPGTGLTLKTVEIRKIRSTIKGEATRMGVEAEMTVISPDGTDRSLTINTLKPRFIMGRSFHLSMMDKGLTDNQARLIVRRDYGLLFMIPAGIMTLIATALYVWFILLAHTCRRDADEARVS